MTKNILMYRFKLAQKEQKLFFLLQKDLGKIVTKDKIFEEIWKDESDWALNSLIYRMRQALSKGGSLERVHLINLPPYAPDYNPIEHVWNTTKDILSNKQDDTFQQTKQKFMMLTDNQIFPYQI